MNAPLMFFFCSFFASLLLINLLSGQPSLRKRFMPQGIPVVGGMAFGLVFIGLCWLIFIQMPHFPRSAAGIILSSGLLFIVGIFDDVRELSIAAKIITQLLAASVLVAFGVKTQIVYIGGLLNLVITFAWILGITNAFNHLDIMDGLAGMVAIPATLAFLCIAAINADAQAIILSLVLLGALLGFVVYNLPPAKVYMGNSGSHFLGCVLAGIALSISYAPMNRKIVLLTPILVLGFPILDTGILIVIRLLKKKMPMQKSNDHIAWRLLKSGLSKRRALLYMAVLASLFSLSGVLVSQLKNSFAIFTVAAVGVMVLLLVLRLSKVVIHG